MKRDTFPTMGPPSVKQFYKPANNGCYFPSSVEMLKKLKQQEMKGTQARGLSGIGFNGIS